MPLQPVSSSEDLNNILFGRVWFDVCCEPDDHPFFQSILSVSFSSSHHGVKWLVWPSIPSPNQQRRPLFSLLSDSYSMFQTVGVGQCDDRPSPKQSVILSIKSVPLCIHDQFRYPFSRDIAKLQHTYMHRRKIAGLGIRSFDFRANRSFFVQK